MAKELIGHRNMPINSFLADIQKRSFSDDELQRTPSIHNQIALLFFLLWTAENKAGEAQCKTMCHSTMNTLLETQA